MKYLWLIFLITSAYAIDVEVIVDGVKVDPKQVELEVGDQVSVTAESLDSNKKPALIYIFSGYAESSFAQQLKETWSKYNPSPQTKEYTVSERNAFDGELLISINASNGNNIGTKHYSVSDEVLFLELKVSRLPGQKIEEDLNPAQITKFIVKKDGQVIEPESTLLKVGDEIEVFLEAHSSEGRIVRGYFYADGAAEPVFQKLWMLKTIFIIDPVPLKKKFRVTRENAMSGSLSVHAVVSDGDLKSVRNRYSDDTRIASFPVEKIEYVGDKNPAKIQKVSVTIQKKNGTVIEASAKPQVYDGGMGKGGPTAPGNKVSPGATGAKAQ